MGKLEVFEIILNNVHGVYFTGEVVQGHVNIQLKEALKLKGIRINFKGKAYVHWTNQNMRGPGESRYREIRHHTATEEYFDVSHTLLTKDPANISDKRTLPSGQYTYPFQFTLPSAVPSSFEGQYGHIRYCVKVMIEIPYRCDLTCQKVFTVIHPLDLNREPSVSRPVTSQKHKRLCCLCCLSGPVSATLCLPQKGFVPGETIYVDAEVMNTSRRKMASSSLEMKMTTTFYTTSETRSVTRLIMKRKRGKIPSGDCYSWNNEPMVIPPLPPSHLIGCNIIDVKYTLVLGVEPVGPAFDLTVPIEVYIGTVPLHSSTQRHLTDNNYHQGRQSHVSGAAAADQLYHPNVYPAPPGFAKYQYQTSLVAEEEDDERNRGDKSYTPAYIYYMSNNDQNNSNHPP